MRSIEKLIVFDLWSLVDATTSLLMFFLVMNAIMWSPWSMVKLQPVGCILAGPAESPSLPSRNSMQRPISQQTYPSTCQWSTIFSVLDSLIYTCIHACIHPSIPTCLPTYLPTYVCRHVIECMHLAQTHIPHRHTFTASFDYAIYTYIYIQWL